MNIDERLERLTGVVETLAASVVTHDDQIAANGKQIEALISFASKHERGIEELRKLHEEISRQFQAYLNTIHPKQ